MSKSSPWSQGRNTPSGRKEKTYTILPPYKKETAFVLINICSKKYHSGISRELGGVGGGGSFIRTSRYKLGLPAILAEL